MQPPRREVGVQRSHHRPQGDVAPPQRGLQLLRRTDGEVRRSALEARGVRRLQPPAPLLPRQDLPPQLEALLLLFPADPFSDLLAGPPARPSPYHESAP